MRRQPLQQFETALGNGSGFGAAVRPVGDQFPAIQAGHDAVDARRDAFLHLDDVLDGEDDDKDANRAEDDVQKGQQVHGRHRALVACRACPGAAQPLSPITCVGWRRGYGWPGVLIG